MQFTSDLKKFTKKLSNKKTDKRLVDRIIVLDHGKMVSFLKKIYCREIN